MEVVLFWFCLLAVATDYVVADNTDQHFNESSPASPACETDSQCATDRSCVFNTCLDPCTFYRCSENATCTTEVHKAKCITEPPSCDVSDDCQTDKMCFRRKCVDPCRDYKCEDGSVCNTLDHRVSCVAGKRGKKFLLVNAEQVKWIVALSRCNSKGMRLASVLNQEENDQLKQLMEEKHNGTTEVTYYWLAGSDAMEEGTWSWMTSGDQFIYTDWHPGEGQYDSQPYTCGLGCNVLSAGLLEQGYTRRYGWFTGTKNHNYYHYVCEYFV